MIREPIEKRVYRKGRRIVFELYAREAGVLWHVMKGICDYSGWSKEQVEAFDAIFLQLGSADVRRTAPRPEETE